MAHRVIHAAVTRYGAAPQRASVTGFSGPDGAVAGVLLDDGRELPAALVINATGPEAASVSALAGAALPIDRQIGMFFSTAPAPLCLRHVVYGSTGAAGWGLADRIPSTWTATRSRARSSP
jgi:hypothetical protein